MQGISSESICFGFYVINAIYLTSFVLLNFVILKYFGNQFAYYLSTFIVGLGTFSYADSRYGHIE